MLMRKRLCKVNISAAGGTAGAGSKTCKITLPSSWLLELGISENNRQMELSFDGEKITVSPYLSTKEFTAKKRALGHRVLVFHYYDFDELCTEIYADYTDQSLRVKNHTEELIKTAFGVNEQPTWTDFLSFLEERCIPRGRSGLREYLDTIGVTEYDPIEIIHKTKGRMAEDQQWLKVEVLT